MNTKEHPIRLLEHIDAERYWLMSPPPPPIPPDDEGDGLPERPEDDNNGYLWPAIICSTLALIGITLSIIIEWLWQ